MKPKVVLIADDDEGSALILREALAASAPGVVVKTVVDGKQTVDYLAGHGAYADRASFPFPDHLFLDIRLPVLSGFEVLRWLRRQPEIGRLRVTVLSGSRLDDDRTRARSLGAGVIVKPAEYAARRA